MASESIYHLKLLMYSQFFKKKNQDVTITLEVVFSDRTTNTKISKSFPYKPYIMGDIQLKNTVAAEVVLTLYK